jgi:spermidine synthase
MRRHPPAILVGLAFTVSGFTSLMLEVVWSKALSRMLGSTLHSVSTVVAAYLGGLALGAYLAGRWSHRVRRPLAAYGLLEMGIGLFALGSLALFAALDPVLGRAYASLGAASPLYLLLRVALAVLALLVPTTCMGATLPYLVAWATRTGTSLGRSLGRFYGLNTLGAVAGSAVAGFVVIPDLGLLGTTRLAGGVALLLGATMAALGVLEPRTEIASEAPGPPPAGAARIARPRGRRGLAAALFGLSGAVALALEITWTRVFSLIFGSSVYSFALVLASYLLALAIGSLLWGGRLADARNPWRSFAVLQAAAAAGAGLGLWLVPELPGRFVDLLAANMTRLPVVYLGQIGIASLVTLLPCLAFGALFPVGARLLSGDRVSGARATGLAYAVNTAGTLTGTLLAGFVLLPTIGIRATWMGSALVALGLAAVAWWAAGAMERQPTSAAAAPGRAAARGATVRSAVPARVRRSDGLSRWVLPGAVGLAVAVAAVLSPPWNKALFTLGVYRSSLLLGPGSPSPAGARAMVARRLREERLIYYREGLHAVISVHEKMAGRRFLSLRTNGKPDASDGEDLAAQIMIGHLPMLWARPGARVCVIGQGSGVTARAALEHDPSRLTLVEIEPAVMEASHYFDDANEDVLADPRIELVIEDGRQHLQHSGRRYDVIVSEPSNPWIAGINNLFTTDFYRRVRDALLPGGVFLQWVQAYELSPVALASLLSSFAETFPAAEVFAFGNDLLLVAPPQDRRVPAERLLSTDDHSPAAAYLARFGLGGEATAASHHIGRIADCLAKLPTAPLNTDDLPFVEYRAPLDLYKVADTPLPSEMAEEDPLAGLARWVADSSLVRVAIAAGLDLARRGERTRAREMAFQLSKRRPSGVTGAFAIADLADHMAGSGGAKAAVVAALAALDRNDLAAAAGQAREALATHPESSPAHLVLARVAMRQEDLATARAQLAEALRWGGNLDRCSAYNNLGIIAMRESRLGDGRRAFEAARGENPGEPNTYLYLARWHVAAARVDSARAVLTEGVSRAYPTTEPRRALAALAAGQAF